MYGVPRSQKTQGWGLAVVERLSVDLRRDFPDMQGFSPRNLWDMRRFRDEYQNYPKLRGLVAEIPWGQNLTLLNSVKSMAQREWYIRQTLENGWSRTVLVHQIESGLCERQGKAATNFRRTLPEPQSDLAQEIVKDPYTFDFLTLTKGARERELERGLLDHIRNFLIELGLGFCFVGSQYRLTLKDKEYFIDLLFFHRHLKCLVALELKMTDFLPEYAGKMNFYLNLLDDQVRLPDENPSIGIILCKSKDSLEVEYALRGVNKLMSVAQYILSRKLPKQFAGELPSPEQLKRSLLK
ncbi:MAG: PDDEXK nuclease domain-containing protein [Elusimicrobiota bacterium]